MRNLISRAPHSIVARIGEENYRKYAGLLTSPSSRFRPETALKYGASWAADNDCFQNYDPDNIMRMLKAYQSIPGCLFVVAPDEWSNGAATLQMFSAWLCTYRRFGYPIAFVAQDGIQDHRIPFDSFEWLFIGGTDTFRKSDELRRIIAEAKQRGKSIHFGRVSSIQRIKYLKSLDVDSFDGTHYTRWVEDVPKHLAYQHTYTEFMFKEAL
jgi:hypothetical protein